MLREEILRMVQATPPGSNFNVYDKPNMYIDADGNDFRIVPCRLGDHGTHVDHIRGQKELMTRNLAVLELTESARNGTPPDDEGRLIQP